MSTTVSTLGGGMNAVSLTARIVPAVVRGEQIFIECPSWCTVDHVEDATGHIVDIWHASGHVDLNAPTMGQAPELMAFAKIEMDRHSRIPAQRIPFITVADSSPDGYAMTPADALSFADSLEVFAAQIRAMARTAGGVA